MTAPARWRAAGWVLTERGALAAPSLLDAVAAYAAARWLLDDPALVAELVDDCPDGWNPCAVIDDAARRHGLDDPYTDWGLYHGQPVPQHDAYVVAA